MKWPTISSQGTKKKSGVEAIKLDMSKSYDRVEWAFLQGMMEKMGFKTEWIDLVMRCVSTISYRIEVNNE